MEEKDNFSSIINFENPASNVLHFEDKKDLKEEVMIEILNNLSQTVLKTQYKNEIDVSNLPNGIYILQLKNSQGQVAVKRLVVSK